VPRRDRRWSLCSCRLRRAGLGLHDDLGEHDRLRARTHCQGPGACDHQSHERARRACADARERHGLDRARLALRAGVQTGTIAALEDDRIPVDRELVETLLLVLGECLTVDDRGAAATEPLQVPVSGEELEVFARLSIAERLARSFAWNRFASELARAPLVPSGAARWTTWR
jgi:transcriptional regulator with XRE-family HTH domain